MSDTADKVQSWFGKISRAEKKYSDYHKLFADIRKYYRNETKADKQNIFWSSVETLKPFLYFKQPKPYIERKNKTAEKVQYLACKMLEKALVWDLEQFDFDSVIKYARNDFLLGGSGIVIERYKADFADVAADNGLPAQIKKNEVVISEYVDPVNFIADVDKVSVWEDCAWFAIKHYISRQQVIDLFEIDEQEITLLTADENGDEMAVKAFDVYEIFDIEGRQIIYVSKKISGRFLKVIANPLALDDVRPFPKPLFATLTNDGIIPVPDYTQIKPLLDELDGVTSRMERTMKALKVSGCYDNAFPELASILNKDTTLVSVADFDRLKEAGGIKNIIDFMPLGQYIEALTTLAERRQNLIASIYDITGVSDIMRGSSNPNETATAVTKKTNFGTLRNQDRQNDMQRFITDLFKIKAEIICEMFDDDKLLGFLSEDERMSEQAYKAVKLLRVDKLRGMVLGIESDVTFGDGAESAKVLEGIRAVSDIIKEAFPVISNQPALLPLYRQMAESICATLPNARIYEPVLEECFNKITENLAAPEPQAPNPELLKVQNQSQKNQMDYQIKKEQNEIKKAQVAFAAKAEQDKAFLTAEEMRLQAELKRRQIDNSEAVSANISTGFVPGF